MSFTNPYLAVYLLLITLLAVVIMAASYPNHLQEGFGTWFICALVAIPIARPWRQKGKSSGTHR